MRFLVDAQLPPLLAHHLASLGHQAEHTADLGLASSNDREIWQYAVANGAIIVTKDEDFVTIRALAESGPSVLWIRIGNTTKSELLKRFTHAWPRVAVALERGETVIEIA
jgi:predicted nuclease of predicted toxin-antitoxin system